MRTCSSPRLRRSAWAPSAPSAHAAIHGSRSMSTFPPHSTTPTRASPALARNLRPRRRPRRVSARPAAPAAPSPRRARLRRAWVDKGSKGSDVSGERRGDRDRSRGLDDELRARGRPRASAGRRWPRCRRHARGGGRAARVGASGRAS